jgi:predicted GH43/DUF377 family glycosyl hydrolase
MSVPVQVERLPLRIQPDARRVLSRFFATDDDKARRRIARVLTLPNDAVENIVLELLHEYVVDHYDIAATWLEHFDRVRPLVPQGYAELSSTRQMLIGAYFTMDYALEAAAIFNPSIVAALDQTGMPPGATRFAMSLRDVGEGHISSIVMRYGIVDSRNNITLNEPPPIRRALTPEVDPEFSTKMIRSTLRDLGALGRIEDMVLNRAGETASPAEIRSQLEAVRAEASSPAQWQRARDNLLSFVESNYSFKVPEGADLSEMVLFPVSQNESRGMEDLRLVRFTEDDGSVVILGTYSAFNGFAVFPTMLVLPTPKRLQSHSMSGQYARNKGMAIFPRKINGRYIMSGRLDGENLFILESENLLVWNAGRLSQRPKHWWQFSVIGNCGSPIETPEGWLMLTHGVGPMRQYCIGAVLLDLEDPARVIGELEEPLISPAEDERVGYVPNVVYTCGSLLHNNVLIIPYAVSDVITKFARVDLEELLSALRRH